MYGGYSDKPSGQSVHLSRSYDFGSVPRVGDYVELTEYGDHRVNTIYWGTDRPHIVQLQSTYTTSDDFNEVVAKLHAAGWEGKPYGSV
jgi:hypothetical protein